MRGNRRFRPGALTFRDPCNNVPFMRPTRAVVLALAVGALLCACTEKLAGRTDLSDARLLEMGQERLAKKKPGDAIEAFRLLLSRYPNSPLAPRAQIGLGEAHMKNGDEVEAEAAFDDFLRLYPADADVPRALFLRGEVLVLQAGAPGRDQSRTVDAVKTYARLLERDPGGPHAAAAAKRIAELKDRLARSEAGVVEFYVTRKRYASAEARARKALSEFPDTGQTPFLLALLARALEKQGKTDDAAEVRRILAERFPGGGTGRR